MTRRQHTQSPAAQKGLTLVELMVAMLLGLAVMGGVVTVVLSSSQSYRTSEALSEVQESIRTAFELLSRDIRQAGETGCGNAAVTNVLAGAAWWQTWVSVRGYTGSMADPALTAGQRIAGTHSIHVQSISGIGGSVAEHDTGAARFTLNAAIPGVSAGDVMMVCDFENATIFQSTAYNATALTLEHAEGPNNSSTLAHTPYRQNAQITPLSPVVWYIGNNGRPAEGGRSLYRARVLNVMGTPTPQSEEIVAGITDLQLLYRADGSDSFSSASDIDSENLWPSVNAIEITLSAESATQLSGDQTGRVSRNFTTIVTIRNRAS